MVSTTANNIHSPITNHPHRLTGIDWVAMTLLIVGGINWGLIGAAGFDLVAFLFGAMSTLTRLIYGLVGLSALYSIYLLTRLAQGSSRKKVTVQ